MLQLDVEEGFHVDDDFGEHDRGVLDLLLGMGKLELDG